MENRSDLTPGAYFLNAEGEQVDQRGQDRHCEPHAEHDEAVPQYQQVERKVREPDNGPEEHTAADDIPPLAGL